MDYNKFLCNIGLAEEGKELFASFVTSRGDLDAFIAEAEAAFDLGNDAFEKYLLAASESEGLDPEQMHLILTLLLCRKAYAKFTEQGIPESVFNESMADISDKCAQNKEASGVYGIPVSELPWFRYHLSAILFRLGRFQYQLAKSEYDIDADGISINKGEACLFVHIPAGEPIDPELCESSYRMALDFFRKYFGFDSIVGFCYSWILQPWIKDVLSPETNIMKFSARYKLIEAIESIPHTFRFIFPKQHESLDDYPADNPLRRMAIERRKRGDLIGYGVGVTLITDTPLKK